jgi:deoxyribodipyrimidine photo-lyase
MNKEKLVVYWSRRDFRLADNPALFHAIEKSHSEKAYFLPIFVLDEGLLGDDVWNIGYPRRFFLSHALSKFSKEYELFGIFKGSPESVFNQLLKQFDLTIYANHDVEEFSRKRDQKIANLIGADKFFSFRDQLTVSKEVVSGGGEIYSVFSPFRNNVIQQFLDAKATPTPTLTHLKYPPLNLLNDKINQHILDTSNLKANEIQKNIFSIIDKPWKIKVGDDYNFNLDNIFERPTYSDWYSTEEEVRYHFRDFVNTKIKQYKQNRNSLGADTSGEGATSRMSVALKWGLISVRSMKDIIVELAGDPQQEGVFSYISELIWREFYRYILYHNPSVLDTEFQKRFQHGEIKWVDDQTARFRFEKWIKGETGYEVVDAAMHQIAKTGWMHNRARMIVASVLTKNLGVDWRWGQEYFRAVLLDLDEASNNGGWQWAASVGADTKPIRIFNPYLQQENYDKNGDYRRHWLPADYNIKTPIVDHKQAREEALKRYGLGGVKPRDY